METVKEKLIKLLAEAEEYERKECEKYVVCLGCPSGGKECGYMHMTDYLIQNGVTIQEWVSVDERLPITKEEAEKYFEIDSAYPQFIVKIKEGVTAGMLEFDGEDWFDVNGYVYNVTHWMPLPQPPKEVQ